nr:hypothetical protein [Thiolinea sp.]
PMPLSVFNFYPPAENRFAVVEQFGKMDAVNDKVASSGLTVNAEIRLSDLIEAQVEWVWSSFNLREEKTESASNSGEQSVASNSGEQSVASNSGSNSVASNSGDQSVASNSGSNSVASNSGDYSAASATGAESVALVTGYQSKARASEGSWIAIVERDLKGKILNFKTAQAGVEVEPDIFYRLKDGAFVIAE